MSRLSPRQTYVPKRARGGEFGQCEDLRRAKPMHQSKSAAAGLGDAKSLATSNLNQKVPQLTFRMRQEFHAAP